MIDKKALDKFNAEIGKHYFTNSDFSSSYELIQTEYKENFGIKGNYERKFLVIRKTFYTNPGTLSEKNYSDISKIFEFEPYRMHFCGGIIFGGVANLRTKSTLEIFNKTLKFLESTLPGFSHMQNLICIDEQSNSEYNYARIPHFKKCTQNSIGFHNRRSGNDVNLFLFDKDLYFELLHEEEKKKKDDFEKAKQKIASVTAIRL